MIHENFQSLGSEMATLATLFRCFLLCVKAWARKLPLGISSCKLFSMVFFGTLVVADCSSLWMRWRGRTVDSDALIMMLFNWFQKIGMQLRRKDAVGYSSGRESMLVTVSKKATHRRKKKRELVTARMPFGGGDFYPGLRLKRSMSHGFPSARNRCIFCT